MSKQKSKPKIVQLHPVKEQACLAKVYLDLLELTSLLENSLEDQAQDER